MHIGRSRRRIAAEGVALVRGIELHPEFAAALREQGEGLFGAADYALLGGGGSPIIACSDYSGDDPQARYWTFATYLTAMWAGGPLRQQLEELSVRGHGVERTLDYKGRKDRAKRRLLNPWMSAFAAHPGVLIVQAFDKSPLPGHQVVRSDVRRSLAGLHVSVATGERLVRAISIFALVGHLLRPTDRVFWLSDRDEIFRKPQLVKAALGSLVMRMIGHPLQNLGFAEWFAKEADDPVYGPEVRTQRRLLSLPDLVAGALAVKLSAPFNSSTVELAECDPGAADILRALTAFTAEPEPGRCRLLVLVWRASLERRLLEPRIARFEVAR